MIRRSIPLWFLSVMLVLTQSPLCLEVDLVKNNGSPGNRVDMTFMGDGWTETQDNSMTETLTRHIDNFFAIPVYKRYAKFFNVYLLHHFRGGPSGGWQTETNFSYYVEVINENVPEAEVRYMVSHSGGYGEGGNVGMASAALSLTSDDSYDVGVHELGHGWHRLGDIYGDAGADWWPNATSDPNSGKWDRWVGYVEPFNNLKAGYWQIENSNYYRSLNTHCCMMADVWCGDPLTYDVVGREKAVLDIYEYVDPLDDWTANTSPLENPSVIEVTPVDPEVIGVDWYVDGELAAEDGGESFDVYQHIKSAGRYTIKARAYDYIITAAYSDRGGNPNGEAGLNPHDPLDWVRQDLDQLHQEVTWQVDISGTAVTARTPSSGPHIRHISADAMDLQLSRPGDYQVDIFLPSGQRLETITAGQAGREEVRVPWNGRACDRQMYLIRVKQDGRTAWQKWINSK